MMLYIILYITQDNNTLNNVDNNTQTKNNDIISLNMG